MSEQSNVLKIDIELDIDKMITQIDKFDTLENNEQLFGSYAKINEVKAKLKQINEAFDTVERQVKYKINDKAKALYGPDWSAIAGTGYKITRSFSGSVYELGEGVQKKFTKVTVAADRDAIDEYVKENSKLPKGVNYNPSRTEVIKVTLK